MNDKKLYPKLNIVEFDFLGVEAKLKLNNKLKWVNLEFRFRIYIEYLQLNTLWQNIIVVKKNTQRLKHLSYVTIFNEFFW